MDELATPADLKRFGGTRPAQRRELDALGIPFREVRGALVVSRYHLRAWLEGRPIAQPRGGGVNMGAVR